MVRPGRAHNGGMRTPAAIVVAAAVLAAASCSDGQPGAAGGALTAPSVSVPTTTGSAVRSGSPGSTEGTGGTGTTGATSPTSPSAPARRTVIANHLDVPWGLAFLPDGSALLTTRDQARLLHLRAGAEPVNLGTVPGVVPGGEGGLLGVAVSPSFTQDRTVFLYLTASSDNRVVRLTFDGGRASVPEPVLTGIPKAGNHNGGRIAFGPDGYLYVATGDAGNGTASQDRGSLGGKILRITRDGHPAPGNPFGSSPVWSYGHRNVQGLAWDRAGRLFASEFGQNTWDELNLITPGGNYGWPTVEGRAGRSGFIDPLRQWHTDDASPSGIAIASDGAVYMAALRGESLWRVPLRGGVAGEPRRLLHGAYGRLRDVVPAPDGRLWVVTNNTARGNPSADDDQVVAIPLSELS